MNPIPPIEIIVPFWGSVFRDCLLTLLLPSLLSHKNLPAWPYGDRTTFVIYTTVADFEIIKQTPELHQLSQFMAIEYRPLPEPKQHTTESLAWKYRILTQIHEDAILRAYQTQSALIFPVADLIFSDGAFTTLAESIAAGAELVMIFGLLVNAHQVYAQYDHHYTNPLLTPAADQRILLSISGAQSIQIYLDNMNALAWSRFAQSEYFSIWPYYLGERQNEQLWLRAFHLHPFFIRQPLPLAPQILKFNTIDGDYLQQYYEKKEHIHIITDHRLICISVTESLPLSSCGSQTDKQQRQQQTLAFALENCAPIHRWFFQHLMTLQTPVIPPPTDSLIECVYGALKPLIQVEEWWYQRNYSAISEYYHKQGLSEPEILVPYLCYYVIQAFCLQGDAAQAFAITQRYQKALRQLQLGPGQTAPIFHVYMGETQQQWLAETPIPIPDLQPGPFVFLWGGQQPHGVVDTQMQWLILLTDNGIPEWLEKHAHRHPEQPLIVLEQTPDTVTLMLLLHRAKHVCFSGGHSPFQADGMIYRVLMGKDTFDVTCSRPLE